MPPQTLYEKIWQAHVVHEEPGQPSLIYIDRHLIHEGTSPQAFAALKQAGRTVRRPELTFAVMDHSVPTKDRHLPIVDETAQAQFEALARNCAETGVRLFDMHSHNQGIVHVIGPELGITQPGQTIVCGDSHTSTHGALGTLAFGIGTSEVEHVLATQCLLQFKSKTLLVRVEGQRSKGVTAKDVILAIIGKIGVAGGVGQVIEYGGQVFRELSMEGRRKSLATDPGAGYDRTVELNAAEIAPQVTWGTNPGMVTDVTGRVPNPEAFVDAVERKATERALDYMGLQPGIPIVNIRLDRVFIGSCTNSRIEDLRAAARVVAGKKVARTLKQALVVPGSRVVKAQAEKEGLDRIFVDAGFEWRDAGCSMCIGMNDDILPSGERCASTSNRNFEGRQGKGGRTHLVSPLMAAAAALEGHFVDIRGWDLDGSD